MNIKYNFLDMRHYHDLNVKETNSYNFIIASSKLNGYLTSMVSDKRLTTRILSGVRNQAKVVVGGLLKGLANQSVGDQQRIRKEATETNLMGYNNIE